MDRTNRNLQRYARVLREAQAGGWTIDVLVEAALGPNALKPRYDADQRPLVLDLYREGIGGKAHETRRMRSSMADEDEGPYENVALQAIGKLIPPDFDAAAAVESLMRLREESIREAWDAIVVDLSDHGMAVVSLDLDGYVRHIQRAAWHRFESAARDAVRLCDFTT